MDRFQRDFIEIIYAAFEQPRHELSSDFDFEKAIKLAKAHNIAAIVYYGALNYGVSADEPYMQELFELTCKSMMVSQRQMYEIGRLEEAFQQAGIEYMPLKGTVLKGMYPRPEMRAMGDADILIKLEQYPRIEEVMKSLGFEFDKESDHELVWTKRQLCLELHKRLVPTRHKDFNKYFDDGWQLSERVSECSRYKMSPENFFLYIFVHFTKHYRVKGIGIKHVLDLWMVEKIYPNLNVDYIFNELKQIGLHEFYENVMATLKTWFSNADENDKTQLITNVIFSSGQYGTYEQGVINRAVLKHNGSSSKARIMTWIEGAFLPFAQMKKRYKVLKKIPILLPIMWIVRWFEILFFRRHVLKMKLNQSRMIEQKNMDEHLQSFRLVGLNTDQYG